MRFCPVPGCPNRVESGRCEVHRPKEHNRFNRDVRRWYRSARWFRLRTFKRTENPLCVSCAGEGIYEPWTDLDHIMPHDGNPDRFWDPANLQGLCHRHHSEKTRREQLA